MQNNTEPPITLKEAIYLNDLFYKIYDENLKPKVKGTVFDSSIKQLDDILFSERVGLDKNSTPKQIELKLQQWFELLTKVPKFADAKRPNDMPKNVTLTPEQLAYLEKQADERNKQSKDAVKTSNQRVRDFERRNKEIYAEQQRIQSEIKAAEEAKVKLAGKVVFAKVILPEPLPLDEIEQGELEVLRNKATKETPEPGKTVSPRVELINDLTIKIEEKIRPSLPTASEEEIEIIARTAAVEIVEKIAKPIAIELNIQTAIYSAINEDKQNVVATVVKDDELLTAAKNGSTLSALKIKNDELTSKLLIENLFGPKLAVIINGYSPEQIKVELTENRVDGQSEYQFDLGRGQESRIQILQNQDSILNSIQDHGQKFGYDSIGNSFTSYARTYLAEKTAAMPAGSIVKKAYSDPIVQSILAKYGLANQVVWETTAQSGQFARFLVKISPDSAGPLLNMAGRLSGSEYVTGIVSLSGGAIGANIAKQAASTYTSIAATDIMAAEAFAGGAGTAASQAAVKTGFTGFIAKIAAFIGAPAGPVGFAISSAISALVVEIGKRINWPAIKKWFQDNKEVFVGLAAGGGLLVGGPVVGGVVLFGGLAAAGMLGTFAAGAFGVLGFIGRSIGIAIATPVIVTLLVIPPLVAFIMLVINNSAYVVPPSFSNDATIPPPPIGGLISSCKESEDTGPEITEELAGRIKNGVVNLLPETVWGRRDGICIKPTMIVMHWSAGTNDNPDGNQRTYETLVARNLSCQLATDTNDNWLMERFFEKMVEFPACAGSYNTYSINNEMAGVYFTANPPPPNLEELELAYDATCKVMDQYSIPWSQIRGHYQVPNSGKQDPGKDFLEKVFIPEIKRRCPNDRIDLVRNGDETDRVDTVRDAI